MFRGYAIACGLLACAPPPLPPVASSLAHEEPWVPATIYRLDLADEPIDARPLASDDEVQAPGEWVVRPEAEIGDWRSFMAAMNRRGLRSFDLSAIDQVDWTAIPHDTERLSVADHALTPQAESTLATLRQLRWLDLSRTTADDALCKRLSEALPGLRRLSVAQTRISDDCTAELIRLLRLERLDFGRTRLGDKGAARLVGLPLLAALVLTGTAVTDASVGLLLDQFAFKRFDASETKVGGRAQSVMTRSTSLERLDLSGTKVTSQIVRSLLRHPYMAWLALSDVPIDDAGARELGKLRRLEVLDLSGTRISRVDGLSSLERLAVLSIARTTVGDLAPLRPLAPVLRYLDLKQTPVFNDALPAIGALTELQTLDLSETAIDDLSALTALRQLRELHLGDTPLKNVDGLAAFPQLTALSLKNCQIHDLSVVSRLGHLQRLVVERVPAPLRSLRPLSQLVLLKANDTTLTDAAMSELPDGMLVLQIARTAVRDEGLARIARLRRLRILDVAGLPLAPEHLRTWRLENLRVLNVSQTKLQSLRDVGLPRSLERLYAAGLAIGDNDLPSRRETPKLITLDVHDTNVTEAAIRSFSAANASGGAP